VWAEALREAVCATPQGQVRYPEGKAGVANRTGNVGFGPLPGGRGRARKPDPGPVAGMSKLVIGEADSDPAFRRPMT